MKALLLDQDVMAGIGNSYVHDILFRARLHPLRPAAGLIPDEVNTLANAIQEILRKSIAKGGAFYEVDLYGEEAGHHGQHPDRLPGGPAVPGLRRADEKIKTGSTSSFVCPRCQPLV